jgi:hypothetical protein
MMFLTTWAEEFPGLLRSTDPRVRLVGAHAVCARHALQGSGPPEGFRDPCADRRFTRGSLEERLRAQRGLFHLPSVSAEWACVDPTDPRPQRTEGIRQWEAWWEADKGRLAREEVAQHY